jgi:protein TonB
MQRSIVSLHPHLQDTAWDARRAMAYPVSLAIHSALAGAAITLSILMPSVLPKTEDRPPITLPIASLGGGGGQPGRPIAIKQPPNRPFAPRHTPPTALTQVATIPTGITASLPSEESPGADGPGDPNSTCVSNCGTGPGDVGTIVAQLPNPQPTPAVPVRISELQAPAKTYNVDPIYPDLARRIHLEGAVALDCTITPIGTISDIRVIAGPPLLQEAAVTAVKQWRYRPTMLGGVPIPILLRVTVQFRLN